MDPALRRAIGARADQHYLPPVQQLSDAIVALGLTLSDPDDPGSERLVALPNYFSDAPRERYYRNAQRQMYSRRCVGNPANLLIDLVIGPNADGSPYRIVMRMRQGRSQWHDTIERPNGTHPDYRRIAGEDGAPVENPTLGSLILDMNEAADRLVKQLRRH